MPRQEAGRAVANKFETFLTANDGVSKVVNKIRRSLGKIPDTVSGVGKNIEAFSRDTEKTFNKTSDSIRNISDSISNVMPMMAGFGAIASVAGVRSFSDEFAKLSRNLTLTGQRSRFTIDQIQTMDAVAALTGGSVEDMNNSLIQFDQLVRSGIYNNPASMGLFKQLGIDITDQSFLPGEPGYQRQSWGILKQVAGRYKELQKFNPSAAENMMQQMGLTGMIPALSMGTEGIDKIEKLMNSPARFKPMQEQIDLGNELFFSNLKLSLSFKDLRDEIGYQANPVFDELNKKMSIWLDNNRSFIAQDIGQTFSTIISGAMKAAEWVEQGGESMHLWGNSAEMVDTIIKGGLLITTTALVGQLVKLAKFALNPIAIAVVIDYEFITHHQEMANWIDKNAPGVGDFLLGMSQTMPMAFDQAFGGKGPFTGGSPLSAPQAGGGNVEMSVVFKNAPPGTQVNTQSSGNVTPSAKVIHNYMPGDFGQ